MKEPKDKRTKEYKEWKARQDADAKWKFEHKKDVEWENYADTKGLGDKISKQLIKISKKEPDAYYDLNEEGELKGLGDVIENFTKKTGIKKAVELFSKATGIDCGCDERKEKLNKLFSYSAKVNCLTEDQYNKWKAFKGIKNNTLDKEQRELISTIYSEVFNQKYFEPCTCNPRAWITRIQQIDKVYSTYEG